MASQWWTKISSKNCFSVFEQMLRCLFLRARRLKRRYVTSGLTLFLVVFIYGYAQYLFIREKAFQGAGERISEHLQLYYSTCENQTVARPQSSTMLCPCLPKKPWIVSERDFNAKQLDYRSVDVDLSHMKSGSWDPPDCIARQRIAVIIPAKNREEHLHILLQHLHPFLQSQRVAYSVYVVDQTSPSLYNKAANMNAAYLELKKRVLGSDRPFDCVIFQDVDQIPMDNRNMYTCFYSPLHLGGYRSATVHERGRYIDSFGGITSLSVSDFEAANGYSNKFWGWGGEDDNFGLRALHLNKGISVYPAEIAQTYRLHHTHDSGNPINRNRQWDYDHFFDDGLNTLEYRLTKNESQPLYTKLYIDLDPLVEQQKCRAKPDILTTRSTTEGVSCVGKSNVESGNTYCCYGADGPYCCGKTLSYALSYEVVHSIHKYPGKWAAGILVVLLVVPLLWRCACRRTKVADLTVVVR